MAALNISGFVLLLPDFFLLLLLLDAKIRAKLRLPRRMEILFIYMSRSDFLKSKTKVNIINITSIYKKNALILQTVADCFCSFVT